MTATAHLYEEYGKDPLFIDRLQKIAEVESRCPSGVNYRALTSSRLKFITGLQQTNGYLTQRELADEINKVEGLLQKDKLGRSLPVGRKTIHHLMKVGGIVPPKALHRVQCSLNSPDQIANRNRYVRRYLQISEDKTAEICFLGEYSFANMHSLSSCPPLKRDEFVDGRAASKLALHSSRATDEDYNERSIQYLLVLGLRGVVYHEIFGDIFREMDFAKVGIVLFRLSATSASP